MTIEIREDPPEESTALETVQEMGSAHCLVVVLRDDQIDRIASAVVRALAEHQGAEAIPEPPEDIGGIMKSGL